MSNSGRPVARVLVADDEEQIRRLVVLLLGRLRERYDLVILEAPNAEEASRVLTREDVHLVISDHNMGGRTGVDLLADIHRRTPKVGRMLITALGELDIGVEAVNRGRVDGFLRKPWDNATFLALVDSLLETRVAQATPVAAPTRAPRVDPEAAERELREIDRTLAQLRVRLGLGSLSAEGYRAISADLAKRRGVLEAQIMQNR